MGFPWHLKGVDVLIRAFNAVSPRFPDYSLRVVGYCPDKTEYLRLRGDNNKISLCDPVPYAEAVRLMSECSLFVLASRTDSSPRVLREAMAARKPIVASNVDGIPELIRDGYNGLLFTPEDHDELAAKIARVLSDDDLAGRLADNGFAYVRANLSEERYLERFRAMVDDVCAG
jgi:glycosyltransferase involved in cell wall biosynthesis